MKHFTAALLSSLQGLTLDPENRIGKQIMARVNHHRSSFNNTKLLFQHLHAVLHNTNNEDIASSMQMESSDQIKETITSGKH